MDLVLSLVLSMPSQLNFYVSIDLPPPKRRRTLAGSIISTALSAALIGTAVGLTVYRLWRNRGKQPEALPPPPYEQGEWVPTPVSSAELEIKFNMLTKTYCRSLHQGKKLQSSFLSQILKYLLLHHDPRSPDMLLVDAPYPAIARPPQNLKNTHILLPEVNRLLAGLLSPPPSPALKRPR